MREKLLQLFETTGLVEGSLNAMEMIAGSFLDTLDTDREKIKDLFDQFLKLAEKNTDELKERYIAMYNQFYTEEDIDALLAFENSPTGKKSRQMSNELMSATMRIGEEFSECLLAQILDNNEPKDDVPILN